MLIEFVVANGFMPLLRGDGGHLAALAFITTAHDDDRTRFPAVNNSAMP